jgi:WD40 repeat protein
MTGKEIKKDLLPYVTLNAQDSVSVLRFTKSNSPKIVVGTKSVNNEYINSLMYIFDSDGKMVGTITNPDEVNCLDTSATNETECVSDCGKSVKIWDIEKMRLKSEFLVVEDNFPTVSLEYNKSGRQILCASDNTVKIWDCRKEEFVKEFHAHTGQIECACWSPDDKNIATVGTDNTIKLWESSTGKLIKMETRPSSKTGKLRESNPDANDKEIGFSKKRTIAFNSNNDLVCADLYLYVYEPGLGFSHAFNFEGKNAPIKGSHVGLANNDSMPQARSLSFIPGNPDYIIAGINDGTVCLCNQVDSAQSMALKAIANNVVAADTGKALGVSPDGTILAVGSFLEQSVRLWKLDQLISGNGSSKSIQSEQSSIKKKQSECCAIN